jgi:hypothetical protein
MLRYTQNKIIKQNHFWCMGHNAILEEDWDDLFAPQLVTATRLEQFEGRGRNEPYTGCYSLREVRRPPVTRNLYRPVWNPPPPPEPPPAAPAVVHRPDPFLFEPPPLPSEPLPRNTQQSQAFWARLLMETIRGHRDLSAGVQPSPKLLPIHPLCYACGYRKGGPDSWDGHRCKCGWMAPPIISKSGNYFYG